MLALHVLDDQIEMLIVSVYRERGAPAIVIRISEQECESMVALGGLPEDVIA
jgi:hypothetical protein